MAEKSFTQWMKEIDAHMVGSIGVSSSDLPDWHYRDAFDNGYTVEEAVSEALEWAGFPVEILDY